MVGTSLKRSSSADSVLLRPKIKFTEKAICHLVLDREIVVEDEKYNIQLYLSQNGAYPAGESYRTFETKKKLINYKPLCDDFGPLNMGSIIRFIQILEEEISKNPRKLVYNVESGMQSLTNAALLLGAYMIIKLGDHPEDVVNAFRGLGQTLFDPTPVQFEGYPDASSPPHSFRLELEDCWNALSLGCDQGWIQMPCWRNTDWGMIVQDEYDHYDSVLNGDLHAVVPGKFVAFRSPTDLQGDMYRDDQVEENRQFSPEYYIDILKHLQVTAVVRVCEPRYDKQAFEQAGISHFDLSFEDCTAPTDDVTSQFFRIVKNHPGVIAVHGRAGLGRTGVLIALYLMRSCGFSARAAIAWLRVMRPGSILGDQQDYLCDVQKAMEQLGLYRPPAAQPRPAGGGPDEPRRANLKIKQRAMSYTDLTDKRLSPPALMTQAAGGGGECVLPAGGGALAVSPGAAANGRPRLSALRLRRSATTVQASDADGDSDVNWNLNLGVAAAGAHNPPGDDGGEDSDKQSAAGSRAAGGLWPPRLKRLLSTPLFRSRGRAAGDSPEQELELESESQSPPTRSPFGADGAMSVSVQIRRAHSGPPQALEIAQSPASESRTASGGTRQKVRLTELLQASRSANAANLKQVGDSDGRSLATKGSSSAAPMILIAAGDPVGGTGVQVASHPVKVMRRRTEPALSEDWAGPGVRVAERRTHPIPASQALAGVASSAGADSDLPVRRSWFFTGRRDSDPSQARDWAGPKSVGGTATSGSPGPLPVQRPAAGDKECGAGGRDGTVVNLKTGTWSLSLKDTRGSRDTAVAAASRLDRRLGAVTGTKRDSDSSENGGGGKSGGALPAVTGNFKLRLLWPGTRTEKVQEA